MTNEERRAALNFARREALRHATEAEAASRGHGMIDTEVGLARMWAHVADAMKDGDPVHDASDGSPAVALTTIGPK